MLTNKGFEQGGSEQGERKETVRWTVFADVGNECEARGEGGVAAEKSADNFRKGLYIVYTQSVALGGAIFVIPEHRSFSGKGFYIVCVQFIARG